MRLAAALLVVSLLGLWAAARSEPELVDASPVVAAPRQDVARPTVATAPDAAVSTVPVSEHALIEPSHGAPARLVVERLGLDAEVVRSGVDERGQFAVPGPDLVGWYEHGPVPGLAGSAVLAAHVDWNHRPGAFADLALLEVGDELEVRFADGTSKEFVVTDQVLYDKTALPAAELFREDGAPVLRLVTCGGAFDPDAGHYLGNRVVSAIER